MNMNDKNWPTKLVNGEIIPYTQEEYDNWYVDPRPGEIREELQEIDIGIKKNEWKFNKTNISHPRYWDETNPKRIEFETQFEEKLNRQDELEAELETYEN